MIEIEVKDSMAQPEKRENSVLFSLRELRQIEENRVQEEEHAVRSAEEQRAADDEARERAIRDAAEAKARAERDEQVRIQQARENAEREARMHVEATGAAEQARQQAALEQERLQQEMQLRRAEVAKKRPTWMLAVMGAAIVAGIIAIVIYVQGNKDKEAAQEKERIARIEADQAIKESKEAQAKVDKLASDLEDLSKRTDKATDAVVSAQNDADRAAAKGKLEQLRKEKADMEQRIQAAKDAAFKAERRAGAHVSQACLDNPLAPGCSH